MISSAQLVGWVRLRSVAGVPEHDVELRRSAQWLAGTLRASGFPVVEVWPAANGGPAVFAEWCAAPGALTVLVYSHHDVRAADDQWEQPLPFEPTLREGRFFGRGASDAKGQVLAHLWAVRALLAHGADHPPVTLKLLVEGEEEWGSPNLAELLESRRDRLDADVVMVSDTMLWAAGAPAVCTGVRGLVQTELEIMGPLTDIHAGAVSGIAPNPITELARVLAWQTLAIPHWSRCSTGLARWMARPQTAPSRSSRTTKPLPPWPRPYRYRLVSLAGSSKNQRGPGWPLMTSDESPAESLRN